ncbi:MAG TPA: hypothetical protein VMG08_02460 [Allosphingosinicella sp.]|nr:hypothetical protein [Allosphingosinicella sp.]
MSLGCLIGRHRPSLVSITRHREHLSGLCEGCGLPLEKAPSGKWLTSRPLAQSPGNPSRT